MLTSRVSLASLVAGAVVLAAVLGHLVPVSASPAGAERPWGKEVLRLAAKGVQIYRCDVDADRSLIWKFVGPKADLLDAGGATVGTHYKGENGPTWEIKGHTVVGTVLRQRPSATAGAVPELQLAGKPADGEGAFKGVTFIERLNTAGGMPPAVDGKSKPGDKIEVPYTAEYVFYGPGA